MNVNVKRKWDDHSQRRRKLSRKFTTSNLLDGEIVGVTRGRVYDRALDARLGPIGAVPARERHREICRQPKGMGPNGVSGTTNLLAAHTPTTLLPPPRQPDNA